MSGELRGVALNIKIVDFLTERIKNEKLKHLEKLQGKEKPQETVGKEKVYWGEPNPMDHSKDVVVFQPIDNTFNNEKYMENQNSLIDCLIRLE